MIASEERSIGSGLHVLIVDDDAHALERMQKRLTLADFRVSVSDVAENLDSRIAIIAPDVVLLDVLMPGLSGKDLLRVLGMHSIDGDPRVILLSPIPAPILRSLIDTTGAFAIVHAGKNDDYLDELVALVNGKSAGALESMPAESIAPDNRAAPLMSGTHRIGGGRIATDPGELQTHGGRRKGA